MVNSNEQRKRLTENDMRRNEHSNRDYPNRVVSRKDGRYDLLNGSKTAVGLYRTMKRLIKDNEAGR